MSEREVIRRLTALRDGVAVPNSSTRPFREVADGEALVVALIRMGGESRPWAIAFGTANAEPTVLSVRDGRNREDVEAMVLAFGDQLVRHFPSPPNVEEAWKHVDVRPQLWLPGPTHLDLLHEMAITLVRRPYEGNSSVRQFLAGNTLAFLFREAHVTGQQTVFVATTALRSMFSFPAEDRRQGHLGFLLAWCGFGVPKGEDRRAASFVAERTATSTSLDPKVEHEEIEPHLERYANANGKGDAREMRRASEAIARVLEREVRGRWTLTNAARGVLIDDPRPENRYITHLDPMLQRRRFGDLDAPLAAWLADPTSRPRFPNVLTDRDGIVATRRYFTTIAAQESAAANLVHDDDELLLDLVEAGEAIEGKIVAVSNEAPPHTGRGRPKVHPVWSIEDAHERVLKIRVGSKLCVRGTPKRTITIRAVEELESGHYLVVGLVDGGKTADHSQDAPHNLAPVDQAWVGKRVGLVRASGGAYAALKREKLGELHEAPGRWLVSPPARPAQDGEFEGDNGE